MDGTAGGLTTASVRFQATDCATLQFKPSFSASTSGHTSKANGASLDAKLAYPPAPPGTRGQHREGQSRTAQAAPRHG